MVKRGDDIHCRKYPEWNDKEEPPITEQEDKAFASLSSAQMFAELDGAA